MRKILQELRETGISAASLPTTLLVVRNVNATRGTFTVKNPDVSQVLDVIVYRKSTPQSEAAPSEFEGFRNIQPGEPRCMDLDIQGSAEVEFRATASGGGINNIIIDGVLV
jgi:hypothetical protein